MISIHNPRDSRSRRLICPFKELKLPCGLVRRPDSNVEAAGLPVLIRNVVALIVTGCLLCACSAQGVDRKLVRKVREMKPCHSLNSPTAPLSDEMAYTCIDQYAGAIQNDYARFVEDRPNLKGSVVMEIHAENTGEIFDASIGSGSTMPAIYAKRLATFFEAYVLLPPSVTGWSGEYPMDFEAPIGAREAARLAIRKRGELPKPAKKAVVASCAELGNSETELKEEAIRACVALNNARLMAEYQLWVKADPTLKGQVVVGMLVAQSGQILSAQVQPETTIDKVFAQKIAEILVLEIRLPSSSTGWKDKYTFNFLPSP